MILNVRAELSSMVNLLVTRITQDPQDKGDFAPSGKDLISFCVKTPEFLWRQSCSPLLPVALGRCLPQTPHRKSHPSERHFYCSCFSAMYPSSRSEEIQMLWMTKFTCRKMKLALSSQVQEWGWLRECGWNKEVGNSRVFSQSHGRPEGRCWPRAHVAKSKTLVTDSLHWLVLLQPCWTPIFSVRQLNPVCLLNYRNSGEKEILWRKCPGNLELKGLEM